MLRSILFISLLSLPVFAGDLDKALTSTCKALPEPTVKRLVDWSKSNKRGDTCEAFLKAVISDSNAAIGSEKEVKSAQDAAKVANDAKATLDTKLEVLRNEVK